MTSFFLKAWSDIVHIKLVIFLSVVSVLPPVQRTWHNLKWITSCCKNMQQYSYFQVDCQKSNGEKFAAAFAPVAQLPHSAQSGLVWTLRWEKSTLAKHVFNSLLCINPGQRNSTEIWTRKFGRVFVVVVVLSLRFIYFYFIFKYLFIYECLAFMYVCE